LVDRHTVQLAGEIPQGHLQAGDRGHHRAALAAGEDVPAAHLLGQPVHVPRILADQLLGHGPHDRIDSDDWRRRIALAQPALVAGPQPDDQTGSHDAYGGGFDTGNAGRTHGRPFTHGTVGISGWPASLVARGRTPAPSGVTARRMARSRTARAMAHGRLGGRASIRAVTLRLTGSVARPAWYCQPLSRTFSKPPAERFGIA